MIDKHNLAAVGRLDGNAYKSSQLAELNLNAAILRVDTKQISGTLDVKTTDAGGAYNPFVPGAPAMWLT